MSATEEEALLESCAPLVGLPELDSSHLYAEEPELAEKAGFDVEEISLQIEGKFEGQLHWADGEGDVVVDSSTNPVPVEIELIPSPQESVLLLASEFPRYDAGIWEQPLLFDRGNLEMPVSVLIRTSNSTLNEELRGRAVVATGQMPRGTGSFLRSSLTGNLTIELGESAAETTVLSNRSFFRFNLDGDGLSGSISALVLKYAPDFDCLGSRAVGVATWQAERVTP